ncbi:nucleoside-diphosphate-sugar epimerase [Rhizobium sp. SG_E_25_P2]|uniref:SDR family oxidoreductase n=1 Tax=Rhizobium sp. SG_E_25_P2 TaxID=2879942 RepID=UPI002473C895|nr:SDR family oxidoreductase [Rhizobium sp. SG_E_25_P2]MDH6265271.1 nucleoside-diphosphate-sugar epimerase [Rhizobium sp. SG_E_25_P2]
MTMTILGAGFSGKAIGALASARFPVYGTTRSQQKFAALESAGIRPLLFDGERISDDLAVALSETTALVQSISPDKHGDGFLRLIPSLKAVMPRLQWVGYLSTIGVYGDHKGEWVDESAAPTPLSNRSRERVLAENQWIDAGAVDAIPVALLRLSGIYGPGRNPFVNLDNGTARRLVKKDQVFNRIRVEDIARASLFLMDRKSGGAFNVTDHMPSPSQDVVAYAAQLMGVAIPPDIAFETAELSPMQRSFYGENKRVGNARIRELGFEFLYQDYLISMDQLWKDGVWRG